MPHLPGPGMCQKMTYAGELANKGRLLVLVNDVGTMFGFFSLLVLSVRFYFVFLGAAQKPWFTTPRLGQVLSRAPRPRAFGPGGSHEPVPGFPMGHA